MKRLYVHVHQNTQQLSLAELFILLKKKKKEKGNNPTPHYIRPSLCAFSDLLEPTCLLGFGCVLTGESWLLLLSPCLQPLSALSISSRVRAVLGHG